MKEEIVLLSASRYSFKDENSGELREGVSVNYVNPAAELTENFAGCRVMKGSLPLHAWKDLGAVPGLYQAQYTMRAGANGRPELRLQHISYVAEVELAPLVAGK